MPTDETASRDLVRSRDCPMGGECCDVDRGSQGWELLGPDVWRNTRRLGTAPFSNVPDETRYSISEEDGRVVVRADSRTSASALLKKISVDPAVYPNLHWSWKTEASCYAGHWGEPEIDDFPLRLFVLFEGSGGFFSFFKRLGSNFSGDAVLYVAGPLGQRGAGTTRMIGPRISATGSGWCRSGGPCPLMGSGVDRRGM